MVQHRDIRLLKPLKTRTTGYAKSRVVWTHSWQKFRAEQKAMADGCERCGRSGVLECHHMSYERVGRELPEDVLVVCQACHRQLDRLRRRGQTPSVEITVAGGRRVVKWGRS